MTPILPLQFGLPGGPELLIVLAIIVLLFGSSKLPDLARSSGQALGEFKRGRDELEDTIKRGVEDATIDGDEITTDAIQDVDPGSESEEVQRHENADITS